MNNDRLKSAFESRVNAFLNERFKEGKLGRFVANFTAREEYSCTILNGNVHTKAPYQSSATLTTEIQLRTASGKSAELVYTGHDFSRFLSCFDIAVHTAVEMEFSGEQTKHAAYPQLELCSPELSALFTGGAAMAKLQTIANLTDTEAARVKHERLISREISCALTVSDRSYCDSVGNHASERGASCQISVAFTLTDSSEYSSDIVGTIPTEADCKSVVAEASKNLLKTEIRALGSNKDIAILLTPKAVISLFSDIVLPNLEMRGILDGTGKWGVGDLKQKVVEGLDVRDDPHKRYSPFSSAFDVEGTPTMPVQIMADGVLNHPLFTSQLLAEMSAKDAAAASCYQLTGHADSATSASPTNLFIGVKGRTLDSMTAMLAQAKTVLVISWLTGMSIDPLTGQFALDSEGAKVYENGALIFSTNVTLRGNFFEALADTEKFVGPAERFYNYYAPAVFTTRLSCVSKELGANEITKG